VAIYEMVGLKCVLEVLADLLDVPADPSDAFGRVMHRNLAQRNLSLPGAVFDSPKAQAERFTDPQLGEGAFTHSGAKSLWDVRGDLPKAELAR
jgi:[phosphatase 2A protein]-leucine-carboxy methyltransferase